MPAHLSRMDAHGKVAWDRVGGDVVANAMGHTSNLAPFRILASQASACVASHRTSFSAVATARSRRVAQGLHSQCHSLC